MLQTSIFNQTHALIASNRISLLGLEGIRFNYIHVPVLIILLNPLPVLVALTQLVELEDTLRDTLVHPLVHVKYSSARWVSRKLRPKSETIPCYTTDCFVLFTVRQCNVPYVHLVLQRDSRFVSRNCHATRTSR